MYCAATLIGAPIAGSLLKTNADGHLNFIGVQIWSGVCLMVGTGFLLVLWFVTMKTQNKGWRI